MAPRAANILFKDKLAGELEETRTGGTRFVYARAWPQEIACCFPITQREHEWRQGLHPFFQHLGPEGWLRERQARIAHIAEEDDLGLLLRYGADCIGAVGVLPRSASVSALAVEAAAAPSRTVSGIQKKVLAIKDAEGRFRTAGAVGVAPYIAKFNSESIPTLVRNENLSLRWLSRVLGADDVTAFALGTVVDLDEVALVVTRFDRTPTGEKLRQEDFAQILCKPRGFDYGGKYEGSYEEVADVIRTHSARPQIDLLRLFRRLVVFVLLNNADAHLKNFSLLETATGLRLSPAYDVINTALYEGYDQRLALTIGGEKLALEQVSQSVLGAFGREIGLPESAVRGTLADLGRAARNSASLLTPPAGEDPDGFVTRFSEIVRQGCLTLRRIAPLNWEALVAEAVDRRKAEKLTQREHAALASVSIPTMIAFERGETTLSLAKAFDILRAVGLIDEPPKSGTQERFVQDAFARWRELTAPLPEDSSARFPHGWYRIDYCLEGDLRDVGLLELEKILGEVVVPHTGWPEFIVLTRPELAPREVNGAIEVWLPPNTPDVQRSFDDAAHCDFWKVTPSGRAFLIRGFQEDGQETFPPRTIFDTTLAVWRLGEALLHAERLTRKLASDPTRITIQMRALYTGLSGRLLRAWANPMADLIIEGNAARSDEAMLETPVPATQVQPHLAEFVLSMVTSLYERFGVTGLSLNWVEAELRRMRQNRSRPDRMSQDK